MFNFDTYKQETGTVVAAVKAELQPFANMSRPDFLPSIHLSLLHLIQEALSPSHLLFS